MSSFAPSQPVPGPEPQNRSMSPGAFGAWMLGLALYAVGAVAAVSFVARYNPNVGLDSAALVQTPQGTALQLTVEFKEPPDYRPEDVHLEVRTGGPGNFQFERYDWPRLALLDADPRTMPEIPPPTGLVTTFTIPLTATQSMALSSPGAEPTKVFLYWGASRSAQLEL